MKKEDVISYFLGRGEVKPTIKTNLGLFCGAMCYIWVVYCVGLMVGDLVSLPFNWYSAYAEASEAEANKQKIKTSIEEMEFAQEQFHQLLKQQPGLKKCIRLYKQIQSVGGTPIPCKIEPVERVSTSSGTIVPMKSETIKTGSFAPYVVDKAKPYYFEPSELFGPTKVSDKCYISQTESEHVIPSNGGMFATDIACNFGEGLGKRAEIYVPDLRDKGRLFVIEHIGYDNLLGSFVQLRTLTGAGYPSDESFYLAHVETRLKIGDIVTTGQILGQMILNGSTTGWHVHVEYRRLGYDGKTWKSERYFTGGRERSLDLKRKGISYRGWRSGDKFYFTSYNVGRKSQNDSSPCYSASGYDICRDVNRGEKLIALTVDVRESLGIRFGDSVELLEGPCPGKYFVHDEKNVRFRHTGPDDCIQEQGACNKGDIAISFDSNNMKCSGVYKVLFRKS